MSRSTRRLALRASIEKSRARGLESATLLRQLELTQHEQRVDAIEAAGQQREIERAFRIGAIAHPHTHRTT